MNLKKLFVTLVLIALIMIPSVIRAKDGNENPRVVIELYDVSAYGLWFIIDEKWESKIVIYAEDAKFNPDKGELIVQSALFEVYSRKNLNEEDSKPTKLKFKQWAQLFLESWQTIIIGRIDKLEAYQRSDETGRFKPIKLKF